MGTFSALQFVPNPTPHTPFSTLFCLVLTILQNEKLTCPTQNAAIQNHMESKTFISKPFIILAYKLNCRNTPAITC